MNKFEQIYRKFLGSLNKLDHTTQFAVVGGFLILVYIFQVMKKRNRRNNKQYQQIRQMASYLVNKDRQKRDGIIWFFNLFVFAFFFTLLSYMLIYVSEEYNFKPIMKFISVLKVSYSSLSLYFRIAILVEITICLVLFKLIHYYNNRLSKQTVITDSTAQEERDKQLNLNQNLDTKTMNDIDLQKESQSKKND